MDEETDEHPHKSFPWRPGMLFLQHFLHGIPKMFCENIPNFPFPLGPHSVEDSETHVILLIPVPGLGKEEINLEVKGHFLKVVGHKKDAGRPNENPPETPSEPPRFRLKHGFPFPGMDYWVRDKFHFYVPIPLGADTSSEVKARVEKGLLHVTFQKLPGKKLPVE